MTDGADIRVRDPVCGREFGLAEAAEMLEHRGWAHFFCSMECRDIFGRDPSRFGDGKPQGTWNPPEADAPGQWTDLINETFKPEEDKR